MACDALPEASPQDRLRVWEARGIPSTWSTGTISKRLSANGFHDVELTSNPSRDGGWIFRAKNSASAACFAFENSAVISSPYANSFGRPRNRTRRPSEVQAVLLRRATSGTVSMGQKAPALPLPYLIPKLTKRKIATRRDQTLGERSENVQMNQDVLLLQFTPVPALPLK